MAMASDLIPLVRNNLGDPSYDKVSPITILLKASQVIATLSMRLKLTTQDWFFQKQNFTVYADAPDFSLALPNCDTVLGIEWINPLSPNDIGVPVQLVDFNILPQVPIERAREIYANSGPVPNIESVAHAMAITGFGGNLKGRVVPTPKSDFQYRAYFEPTADFIRSYSEVINLPSSLTTYVALMTADGLVSKAWGDLKDEGQKCTQTRKDINGLLRMNEANFEWLKGNNKGSHPTSSRGYMPPGVNGYRFGK